MISSELRELLKQKIDLDNKVFDKILDEFLTADSRISFLEYEQRKERERRMKLIEILKDPEDEYVGEDI